MAMKIISVTDVGDFIIGNAENSEKGTGCTVIICENGAVGGVDVRGGGPATRETDLLRSENTVNAVNAVVLSGGSAFGLEAASGVMRELADRGVGFDVGDDIVVPIVCGASLYDLPVGDHKAFPDVYMGAQAVRNAYDGQFANGNHGAGTGATVGKIKGYGRAMKCGLGTFACGDGIIEVGAIAAVNAVGDVYNGAGKIIAGLRSEDGKTIYGTIKTLKGMVHDKINRVDDSTSFINRYDIEEALAAAAKQYEAEKAAAALPASAAEPETEASAEIQQEETAEAVIEETPIEENEAETEAVIEEAPEEEAEVEEEAAVEEAPVEETESKTEEIIEETAEDEVYEEATGESEEFIPETPSVDYNNSYMGSYAEISIPQISDEPAVSEEVTEEAPAEEPEAVEIPEETVPEEPEEVFEETPVEVPGAVEIPVEPAEEIFEVTPAEEPETEEIPEETVPVEPAEEIFEETSAEEPETEEIPEETVLEEPEEAFEETPAEEPETEEIPEETVPEEPAEEPVVLTREEMGYDITFNTTISCLITNAALTKSQANKLASILHDAYARSIKPVHGTLDGDTVFVLATGKQKVNFDAFAALATDIMQYAIIDAATSAESAYGLPAAKDMKKSGE